MPLVDHTVGSDPPVAVVGGHNGIRVHYYSAVASAESADTAVAVVVAVVVVVVAAVVEAAAAVADCQHCEEPGNLLGSGTAFRSQALAVGTSPRIACIVLVLASVWVRGQVLAVLAFYWYY